MLLQLILAFYLYNHVLSNPTSKAKLQVEAPKSEIRMGYGLLYQAEGILLHGLNKYNLIVGIDMPTFNFTVPQYYKQFEDYGMKCNRGDIPKEEAGLYIMCEAMWPLYSYYRQQELHYQSVIQEQICKDLPAMLTTFLPPDEFCTNAIEVPEEANYVDRLKHLKDSIEAANAFHNTIGINMTSQNININLNDKDKTNINQQNTQNNFGRRRYRYRSSSHFVTGAQNKTRTRKKRFVSTLVSLAYDGFKTYLSHKRDQKFMKGLKILAAKQVKTDNKIRALHTDMMAVAKATLQDINTVKNDITHTNHRIDIATTRLGNLQKQVIQHESDIKTTAIGLEYVSYLLGVILPQMERGLSQYEHIMHKLDMFINAIDDLSNGNLSPAVIRPGILQSFISQVENDIRNYFPEYTLALNVAETYYNLPIVRFAFQNNMLAIQIPLFVQHHTQQALNLYNLRTVPVPYHINENIFQDDDGKPSSYTWLHPKHQMLAMSYSTYIALTLLKFKIALDLATTTFVNKPF